MSYLRNMPLPCHGCRTSFFPVMCQVKFENYSFGASITFSCTGFCRYTDRSYRLYLRSVRKPFDAVPPCLDPLVLTHRFHREDCREHVGVQRLTGELLASEIPLLLGRVLHDTSLYSHCVSWDPTAEGHPSRKDIEYAICLGCSTRIFIDTFGIRRY